MTIIKTARNLIASGKEDQCVNTLINWMDNTFAANKDLKTNKELKEVYNNFYLISSTINAHRKDKLNGTRPDSFLLETSNKSTKFLLHNISELEIFLDKSELNLESHTSQVEITINADFDTFSEKELIKFLKKLSKKLKIKQGEIKIKMKKRGSVKLIIELPSDKVLALKQLFLNGDLDTLKVMDTKLLEGMSFKNIDIKDSTNQNIKEERKRDSKTIKEKVFIYKELRKVEKNTNTALKEDNVLTEAAKQGNESARSILTNRYKGIDESIEPIVDERPPSLSPRAQEDYRLVLEAIEGNQKAYTLLMERYRNPIFHMMLKMINNRDDADDLTLEAFGKAFNKLPSYAPGYAFSTWLFKIAINNCIDHIRKKRLHLLSIDDPIEPNSEHDFSSSIRSKDLDPEEQFIRKQRINLIRVVLGNLSLKYRLMIELRFFEELSYDEIAKELDIPLGTVKAQLFRAKEILFQLLQSPEAMKYLEVSGRRPKKRKSKTRLLDKEELKKAISQMNL